MPVITFQGPQLSTNKKEELIDQLTATAVQLTGAPSQYFTVIIQEFSEHNLGVNGETVAAMKSRLQGQGREERS